MPDSLPFAAVEDALVVAEPAANENIETRVGHHVRIEVRVGVTVGVTW